MVTRHFLQNAASEAKAFQLEVDKVLLAQREINIKWNSVKNEAEKKVLHEPIQHSPSPISALQYNNSNNQQKKRNIKSTKSFKNISKRNLSQKQGNGSLTARENLSVHSQENFWITTQLSISKNNPIYFQVPSKSSHHFELSKLPLGTMHYPRPCPTPFSARCYAKKTDN